ncbi:hypothetical protein OUZ56_012651 [Daphnia magna]|uniref:Uncharacterized protein n=1 Tax=Daphnia magna TaxID=35525 RepID=A0ABQ9Z3Q1_9CRUS|nr:hypothetical protein OUZ56_012651 [Daphnia magna]
MEIFGLRNREFFLYLGFIKTYLNIDSANIYTTLTAPFSPKTHILQISSWMLPLSINLFEFLMVNQSGSGSTIILSDETAPPDSTAISLDWSEVVVIMVYKLEVEELSSARAVLLVSSAKS